MSVKYQCMECGVNYPIQVEACSFCGGEVTSRRKGSTMAMVADVGGVSVPLADIRVNENERYYSGIAEFDRATNGIVHGGSYLIGGNPGVGKSTLLMQTALRLGVKILYVSGEENKSQLKGRANRLVRYGGSMGNVTIFIESEVDRIIHETERVKPALVIVDSTRTLFMPGLSQTQQEIQGVKTIQALCKSKGIAVLFIGHVTKAGDLAGNKTLQHLVDCTMVFEQSKGLALLRTDKNRFGANDTGVLRMAQEGLVSAAYKLSDTSAPGRAIAMYQEVGNVRVLPLEIDALCRRANESSIIQGLDNRMVRSLWAVLDYYLEAMELSEYQLVLSCLEAKDSGLSLAVLGAMMSSLLHLPVEVCFIGDVRLSGIIEESINHEKRVEEAHAMNLEVVDYRTCATVKDFIKYMIGLKKRDN